MILSYNRSEKLRLATMYAAVSSVLIAIVAYLMIASLGHRADARRLDEIKIASLQNQFSRMQGIVDGATVGLGTSRFVEAKNQADSLLAELGESATQSDVDLLRRYYRTYLICVDGEIQAARGRNFRLARSIDFNSCQPAHKILAASIDRVSERLSADAKRWSDYESMATAWSLLGAALFLSVVVALYHKKVMTVLTMEATQLSVQASESRFRALVQNSSDVIAVTSPDGVFKLVSDGSICALGRTPGDIVGNTLLSLIHRDDSDKVALVFGRISGNETKEAELTARVVDGVEGFRSHQIHLTNLSADPNVAGILITFHDLTERMKLEEELAHHAFHDRLTGLPNRTLFMDRLAHRLTVSERNHDSIVVMFVDLDNFKVVNDSLGHEAGDSLLIEAAARFQQLLRPGDTVARLGGDEFTIILDGSRTEDDAASIANRILEKFDAPFAIGEREVFVSASIGIAVTRDYREDPHAILRDADTAMYRAKGHGKASYVVFDRSMNVHAMERLELESDLRSAVDHGQFSLRYQPIVDITTGQLKEVEVLLRWKHPSRGAISPNIFIPIAEETGLICSIGHWVLREACAQLRIWRRGFKHFSNLGLSVNVSGRQFYQPDFVQSIRDLIQEFELDASSLKLEITETAMLNDLERIRLVFEELREVGVRIAIDDFGTGYSSMSYLSHLPVDTLKIDRSFVSTLGDDSRIDGVVRAMISMAQTLGLDVTSEGIETAEQLGVLRSLGCDSGQGFLFAKPLTAMGIAQFLAAPRTEPVYRSAA